MREKLTNLQAHATPIAPARLRRTTQPELATPLPDAILVSADPPTAPPSIHALHPARRVAVPREVVTVQ